MKILALLALVIAAAVAVVPTASAKDRRIAGGCSASGDVCTEIGVSGGALVLGISTQAKYFPSYQLCVKGPKSKVCKSFAIRAPAKAGDTYFSKVAWRKNFPNQGPGVYRVTWGAGKPLSFRLPLA
jgi:hypothetical protein